MQGIRSLRYKTRKYIWRFHVWISSFIERRTSMKGANFGNNLRGDSTDLKNHDLIHQWSLPFESSFIRWRLRQMRLIMPKVDSRFEITTRGCRTPMISYFLLSSTPKRSRWVDSLFSAKRSHHRSHRNVDTSKMFYERERIFKQQEKASSIENQTL